jgi:transcriptional regulator with XRE-family HTH domain
MSQRALAARSGIDASTVSRLERGVAGTMTLTVLHRLAVGLDCEPEMLVSPDTAGADPADNRKPDTLVDLQRALIGTTLEADGPHRPAAADLERRTAAVRRFRLAMEYRRAIDAATRCLPDAHADAVHGTDRRRARARLVHLCFDVAMTARRLGDAGSAWIAATRAQQAAVITRQALLIAGATFCRAYVALGRELPVRARYIIEPYAGQLRPRSPELAGLRAMLHLCAGLAITRSRGSIADRDRHLADAEAMLALTDGDSDPFDLHFNAPTMWQWRMNIGLESRDVDMAIDAFAHIRLDEITQPNRQAVYFIDLARLHVATGRWQDVDGLLARADRLATAYVATDRAAQRLNSLLRMRQLGEVATRDHRNGIAIHPMSPATAMKS